MRSALRLLTTARGNGRHTAAAVGGERATNGHTLRTATACGNGGGGRADSDGGGGDCSVQNVASDRLVAAGDVGGCRPGAAAVVGGRRVYRAHASLSDCCMI